MAALKIFGIGRSRAFRNLWAAEETGMPYELVEVQISDDGCRSTEFRKINPNGQVPAIDDNGFVMSESLAINLYLAKKSGKIFPSSLLDEAKVLQWTLWSATQAEPNIMAIFYNRIFYPPEQRNEAIAKAAEDKVRVLMAVLDGQLSGRDWLVGNDFTVADLNLAVVIFFTRALKFDLTPWPNVNAWLERCLSRPAALRALKYRE